MSSTNERLPIPPARWTEPQDADDIVMVIMTMHWDMAACQCWVCRRGRELGLHSTSDFLDWRQAGRGFVDVKPSTVDTTGDLPVVDYARPQLPADSRPENLRATPQTAPNDERRP